MSDTNLQLFTFEVFSPPRQGHNMLVHIVAYDLERATEKFRREFPDARLKSILAEYGLVFLALGAAS